MKAPPATGRRGLPTPRSSAQRMTASSARSTPVNSSPLRRGGTVGGGVCGPRLRLGPATRDQRRVEPGAVIVPPNPAVTTGGVKAGAAAGPGTSPGSGTDSDAPSTGSGLVGDQNVLVVGIDSRTNARGEPPPALLQQLHAGASSDGGDSTDTMIVVHIPAGGAGVTAISIPRDSYVLIAGGFGRHKINSAYPLGAHAATGQLIEQGLSGAALRVAADTAGGAHHHRDRAGPDRAVHHPLRGARPGRVLPTQPSRRRGTGMPQRRGARQLLRRRSTRRTPNRLRRRRARVPPPTTRPTRR